MNRTEFKALLVQKFGEVQAEAQIARDLGERSDYLLQTISAMRMQSTFAGILARPIKDEETRQALFEEVSTFAWIALHCNMVQSECQFKLRSGLAMSDAALERKFDQFADAFMRSGQYRTMVASMTVEQRQISVAKDVMKFIDGIKFRTVAPSETHKALSSMALGALMVIDLQEENRS